MCYGAQIKEMGIACESHGIRNVYKIHLEM